jgi:hypothetical protein
MGRINLQVLPPNILSFLTLFPFYTKITKNFFQISYVGFKGKATSAKRKAVHTSYESIARKSDHEVPIDEQHLRFGV